MSTVWTSPSVTIVSYQSATSWGLRHSLENGSHFVPLGDFDMSPVEFYETEKHLYQGPGR